MIGMVWKEGERRWSGDLCRYELRGGRRVARAVTTGEPVHPLSKDA